VELSFSDGYGRFKATGAGIDLIASGAEPRIDEETRPRPISAVYLPLTGSIMRTSDVRFIPAKDKQLEKGMLIPLGQQLDNREQMETIYDRLTETVRLRPNEVVRSIDSRSTDIREGFVEIREDTLTNLPKEDAQKVARLVKSRRSGAKIEAFPLMEQKALVLTPQTIRWDARDIVVGGSNHRDLLEDVLKAATERVVILSTFIDAHNVEQIWPSFESAAERGVNIDLLYGAAGDDAEKHSSRAAALSALAARSRNPNKIRVHRQSVDSHAKFVIADNGDGDFLAIVGSCNWLSTPFNAVEISVILRHRQLVAQIAKVCRTVFLKTQLSNDLVAFIGTLAHWGDAIVATAPAPGIAECRMQIVLANEHTRIVRKAATDANNRLIIGSHRFGSTAEQAMLVAAANAAQNVTDMRVIYTQIRKPQFRSDVTALREEYEPKGVKFVHLDTQKKRTPIHGKFLLWDTDDAVITSLNWASATVSDVDIKSEIGIHLSGPGVADTLLEAIKIAVPRIDGDFQNRSKS
jgi:phosphatidylserine/phosphatidylglycerophosphate/cardiolipin synthase-like enzyme